MPYTKKRVHPTPVVIILRFIKLMVFKEQLSEASTYKFARLSTRLYVFLPCTSTRVLYAQMSPKSTMHFICLCTYHEADAHGQTIVIPKTRVSENQYNNYFPNYSYTFLGFYQKDKLYKNNIIFSAFNAFFMNSLAFYAYTTYSNLNTLFSSLIFCLDCTQSIVIVVFSSRMVCLD